MTTDERLIVSAYTGHMMVPDDKFLRYSSRVLERDVYKHDLIHGKVWKQIRERVEPEFKKLCRG